MPCSFSLITIWVEILLVIIEVSLVELNIKTYQSLHLPARSFKERNSPSLVIFCSFSDFCNIFVSLFAADLPDG